MSRIFFSPLCHAPIPLGWAPEFWHWKKIMWGVHFLLIFGYLYSESSFSFADLESMKLNQKGVKEWKNMVKFKFWKADWFWLVLGICSWQPWTSAPVTGLSFIQFCLRFSIRIGQDLCTRKKLLRIFLQPSMFFGSVDITNALFGEKLDWNCI